MQIFFSFAKDFLNSELEIFFSFTYLSYRVDENLLLASCRAELLRRGQRMSAASWGTLSEEQARRHCSINNTQPNRSQHILFTSSTHFIFAPVRLLPSPRTTGGKVGPEQN